MVPQDALAYFGILYQWDSNDIAMTYKWHDGDSTNVSQPHSFISLFIQFYAFSISSTQSQPCSAFGRSLDLHPSLDARSSPFICAVVCCVHVQVHINQYTKKQTWIRNYGWQNWPDTELGASSRNFFRISERHRRTYRWSNSVGPNQSKAWTTPKHLWASCKEAEDETPRSP